MLINLSDVFSTTGKVLEEKIVPDIKVFDAGFGEYELQSAEPFILKFENAAKGKALITGNTLYSFKAQCDRCLKPVSVPVNISICRECASPEFVSDDPYETEELHAFMEGYSIDTDELLHDEITVNWPVKILCREDCKGLCPVCGHDLNEGDCGCDTFVPDPRMAAIFDKLKEST